MKVSILLCCFFLLFNRPLISQNTDKTDSLLRIYNKKEISDKQRLLVLQDIAFYHPVTIEGLEYAKKALNLAKKMSSAIDIAYCYETISSQHRLLGNKVAALEAALSAMKIYESIGSKENEAAIHVLLGEHYTTDTDYPEAIRYFKKGLKLHNELLDTFQMAVANINLGEAHRLFSKSDSAEICFEQALTLNQYINDSQIQSYAIGNLGLVSSKQGKIDKAIEELKLAILKLRELRDFYSVSIYLTEMGKINAQKNNTALAEQQLIEALKMAEGEQLKEQVRDISLVLVEFYEKNNQYAKSLGYQKLFQIYQDSLVNRENVKALEQMKAGHEIDKREIEIGFLEEQRKKQEIVNYSLLLGILTLVIMAISLIWSYLKLQQRKNTIAQRESEKSLLLKELNHRVKNNLQMISGLLNLQSRDFTESEMANIALKEGKMRVEALSLIHQKLYTEEYHTQVSIKEYLEELVSNLRDAYAEHTGLKFDLQEIEIDIDIAIPIALIVNELTTNSFKYAFDKVENPEISIKLIDLPKQIIMQIQDNGKGIDQEELDKISSFGLKLVHSLIRQINGTLRLEQQKGSCWEISINK